MLTEIPPPKPPKPPHRCSLPYGDFGRTGRPDGTIVRCLECGHLWYSTSTYYGVFSEWRRVRPWHFRLNKRIDEAQIKEYKKFINSIKEI